MFTLDTFLPYMQTYIRAKGVFTIYDVASELLKVTPELEILRIDVFFIKLIEFHKDLVMIMLEKDRKEKEGVIDGFCQIARIIYATEDLTYFEKAFIFICVIDSVVCQIDNKPCAPLENFKKLITLSVEQKNPLSVACLMKVNGKEERVEWE